MKYEVDGVEFTLDAHGYIEFTTLAQLTEIMGVIENGALGFKVETMGGLYRLPAIKYHDPQETQKFWESHGFKFGKSNGEAF